jgi:hypothetical protein
MTIKIKTPSIPTVFLVCLCVLGARFLFLAYVNEVNSEIANDAGEIYGYSYDQIDSLKRQCSGSYVWDLIKIHQWSPRDVARCPEVYDLCNQIIKRNDIAIAREMRLYETRQNNDAQANENFVISQETSTVFHLQGCRFLTDGISTAFKNRDVALASGKRACETCKP